jgi:hypothetical protein
MKLEPETLEVVTTGRTTGFPLAAVVRSIFLDGAAESAAR